MTTSNFDAKTHILSSGRINVLFLENLHANTKEILASEGFQVESLQNALSEEALIEKLQGVHVLGIRSKTLVTQKVLENAKELLTVGCFCIGTNQVDIDAAQLHGIPVFNAPFANTRSVAELMIAEIILLARQLGDRSSDLHKGKWRKTAEHSYEIRGKTLGIVGYGHIGSQVGVLAELMGMRVIYFDVVNKLPMGNNRAVSDLFELLRMADFVCLHVPETAQTRHLIGTPEIKQMKAGSYLLNSSRGAVVDISALSDALKSKHLFGAAVDVYPEEPEGQTDSFVTELQGLANVLLTPHIGGSTLEAQAAIGREVGEALANFITRGSTSGAVNFPQLDLPRSKGTHRILNVHKNVPGVLRDINKIVSDHNANIHSQMLSTDARIGYLIMDLDHDVSVDVCAAISKLSTNLRTRIVS
ncbi:MAG: phosphoglycerate dehydrogenase [Deltaproteobacteria bacterium]|nr:phosphoglycerate dehydrogenase [Deltaproteobacteria bacterium]